MQIVLILAPHPDDETLGCGGTILRHRAQGDRVHWVIATEMTEALGFSAARIAKRDAEIAAADRHYGFAGVHRLGIATTRVDSLDLAALIEKIASAFHAISPSILYLPHHGDAHSDHRGLHEAALAAAKWFRQPSIRTILSYEVLSETNFPISANGVFQPNRYVDISSYLEAKIEAMRIFDSEVLPAPFPRSVDAIRALAVLRGSEAGFHAAEAFRIIKDRQPA